MAEISVGRQGRTDGPAGRTPSQSERFSLGEISLIVCLAFVGCALQSQVALSQMVDGVGALSGFGNSWYERQGVGFGFWLPGGHATGSRVVGLLPNGQFTPNGQLQFSQGSLAGTVPLFGGYDPNAAGRLGFGVGGQGGGFRLGFEFGKGSTRSITSTAPSLMVQNGGGGFIGSGQWTPFVTGWIPVVGDFSNTRPVDNAVTRAVQSGQLRLDNLGDRSSENTDSIGSSAAIPSNASSTAEIASESVAAIRASKNAEKESLKKRLAERMAEYEQHLAAGKLDLARLALVHAIPLEADPARKQQLRELLKSTR